jgi:hypothetical protein
MIVLFWENVAPELLNIISGNYNLIFSVHLVITCVYFALFALKKPWKFFLVCISPVKIKASSN